MNVYTSKYDLKNNCLRQGDHVLFSTKGKFFDYLVRRNYLSCALSGDDKIFRVLGLDAMEFANQCYGYNPLQAEFPKCIMGDYKALTRLVIALFEECEKMNHAIDNATFPVSKRIIKEMCNCSNEAIKKINLGERLELVNSKLNGVLKCIIYK